MTLTKDQVYIISHWIEENIMRNPAIMFNDECRGTSDEILGNSDSDLVEVIASLFEIIHRMALNEPYHYMFHWANKIGSWVEDDEIFIKILEEHFQELVHKDACLRIAELCNKAKEDLMYVDTDSLYVKGEKEDDQNR